MDHGLTWVVMGAGESLTPSQVEHVRGKAHVICCNNAWTLAPWADAMAARDTKWWGHYGQEALAFPGMKFTSEELQSNQFPGVRKMRLADQPLGCNTGLYAMMVARELGASRILLLGIDLVGTHFFGPHPANLKNADKYRHEAHRHQFKHFSGPPVLNCSPISTLGCFDKSSIFKEL